MNLQGPEKRLFKIFKFDVLFGRGECASNTVTHIEELFLRFMCEESFLSTPDCFKRDVWSADSYVEQSTKA